MVQSQRSRRLATLLASNAFDASGSQIIGVTIDIIAVVSLGFSAVQLGLLNALETSAYLVLALPIGVLVDRAGPVAILRVSIALKLLVVTALTGLALSGLLSVASAMVIAILFGVFTVASETSQISVIPTIGLEGNTATRAVALMAVADRIASVAAPAVAGVIIGMLADAAALGLAGFFLLLALAAALRLVQPRPNSELPGEQVSSRVESAHRAGKLRRVSKELMHGFTVIASSRQLLAVILLLTAGNIGLAMSDSVLTVFILGSLKLGPEYFGVLSAVAALSGIVAASSTPWLMRRVKPRLLFGAAAIAQSVVASVPLLSLRVQNLAPFLLLIFFALWSIAITVSNVAGQSFVVASVPKTSIGRASTASRTITMGSVPLAAVGGGFLADTWGFAVPLTAWPLMTLIAAVGFLLLTRHTGLQRDTEA